MKRKLLVWLGSTRDEVRAFPDDARRSALHDLRLAQERFKNIED